MCGPTSAANSFVYLQNEYPSIYGQALVPGNDYVNGQPSQADLISTADLLASSTYMEYYRRRDSPGILPGLSGYVEACVPNTTVYTPG